MDMKMTNLVETMGKRYEQTIHCKGDKKGF